jgi:hypothetical protein
MPASPAQDFALYRPLPFLEPGPLRTQSVDVGEHSFQQGFGRSRGDARVLKLPDFAALPEDLGTHPLDFGSELVKLHDVLVRLRRFQSAGAQPPSGGPSFSRSRKRFHNLMISRSFPASIQH